MEATCAGLRRQRKSALFASTPSPEQGTSSSTLSKAMCGCSDLPLVLAWMCESARRSAACTLMKPAGTPCCCPVAASPRSLPSCASTASSRPWGRGCSDQPRCTNSDANGSYARMPHSLPGHPSWLLQRAPSRLERHRHQAHPRPAVDRAGLSPGLLTRPAPVVCQISIEDLRQPRPQCGKGRQSRHRSTWHSPSARRPCAMTSRSPEITWGSKAVW